MDRQNLMLRRVEPFEAAKCQHKCAEYCERDHLPAEFSCYAAATHILGHAEKYCGFHIGFELAQAMFSAKLISGMLQEVGVRA